MNKKITNMTHTEDVVWNEEREDGGSYELVDEELQFFYENGRWPQKNEAPIIRTKSGQNFLQNMKKQI